MVVQRYLTGDADALRDIVGWRGHVAGEFNTRIPTTKQKGRYGLRPVVATSFRLDGNAMRMVNPGRISIVKEGFAPWRRSGYGIFPSTGAACARHCLAMMSTLRRPSKPTPAPTIHILGAGAVGLLHAHHLRSKSLPVTLVLRSNAAKRFRDEGEQVTVTDLNNRTLQSQGYIIEELDASPTASAVSSMKNIDICLVCTKSYQTLEAIEPLRHRLTNKSTVVLLHNAVLPIHAKLESLWNDDTRPRICLGMTTHGVRIHPGRFGLVWGGRGETLWGRPPQHKEDQHHRAADAWLSYGLAELSGTTLPWSEMENKIWMKHILNTLLNPVAVLMRTPNGTLPHLHTMRRLLHTLLRPLMPLLPSSFTADAHEVVETCLDVARKTGGNLNSMLVDVESGRKTEVRELVGFWRERLDSMRRMGSDEQWTAVEEGLRMWDVVMLMVEARGEVVRYEEVNKASTAVK